MKQIDATVVSIVVPVCNEVRQIADLMRRMQQAPLPPFMKKEIIVVDDASTDGTREFLREMPCTANLKVIFHERNRGKGAAIRTALEAARGDFVLIQDADLEYDPEDYPALLTPLAHNQANVVYGVRPDRPERGFACYFGAKVMTAVTNLLFRAGIHDEATCYKAFRRSLLRGIKLNCERFEFCPEVTAKVSRLGERIHEVPISYHPRTRAEGKKIRWIDGVAALCALFRYRLEPQSWFVIPAFDEGPGTGKTLEEDKPQARAAAAR
jgi:glycosyltransferase involved in cell wall biosynthesis